MAIDHGLHDLHLCRDIGLVCRAVPNDLDVMLPGAFYRPACTLCQKISALALGITATVVTCWRLQLSDD